MHASKKVFYIGIIAYSLLVLFFWDWPTMVGTTGTASVPWLGKMAVDILFTMGSAVLMFGPSLFANDEEDEDEFVLHKEDLPVSDNLLFGAFLVNIVGNLGWHGFQAAITDGTTSFYYSIWAVCEFVLLIMCWVLLMHTRKVTRRRAQKARREANQATRPQAVSEAA